jgi:hypothetical protein
MAQCYSISSSEHQIHIQQNCMHVYVHMLYCSNNPKPRVTPPYAKPHKLVPPMVWHDLTENTKKICNNRGSSHMPLSLSLEFCSSQAWRQVGVDFTVLC